MNVVLVVHGIDLLLLTNYFALRARATAPDTIGAAAEFWLKCNVVLLPISVVVI